jgi:hypothetical protein
MKLTDPLLDPKVVKDVEATLDVDDVCCVLQGERPVANGERPQRLIDQIEHAQNCCLDGEAMGSDDRGAPPACDKGVQRARLARTIERRVASEGHSAGVPYEHLHQRVVCPSHAGPPVAAT